MKKVRFASPSISTNGNTKDCDYLLSAMDDRECQSPRPFIDRQFATKSAGFSYDYRIGSKPDLFQMFADSNSSPYPMVNKTQLEPEYSPSDELELSILDSCNQEPRHLQPQIMMCRSGAVRPENFCFSTEGTHFQNQPLHSDNKHHHVTQSSGKLPNDNSFFMRRSNLANFQINTGTDYIQKKFQTLTCNKENNPITFKENNPLSLKDTELKTHTSNHATIVPILKENNCVSKNYSQPLTILNTRCNCHPCHIQSIQDHATDAGPRPCICVTTIPKKEIHQCQCEMMKQYSKNNACQSNGRSENCLEKQSNAIQRKTQAIEKYEQRKSSDCLDVEQSKCQTKKEKREPTVTDLFNIIKLQNEQLQLLQKKVDRFITNQNSQQQALPIDNVVGEHVALQTDTHKVSIGVMTSFEMVRTSTIINQEILKQTNHHLQNAQIQCNRSQISIKSITKKQPGTVNFLDGILPVDSERKSGEYDDKNKSSRTGQQQENLNEEKTLNEQSLCNIQVDTPTTPIISPEQTMYLDVRDYSDSESGRDSQSNVGWTYYNKVMTHVNGMLQDSDMPSSASALYRNTRQQCVQMQIDKTNLSVTKRVKFGDDPLGIHQPHIYQAASTDTSVKMNQLALKYLAMQHPIQQPALGNAVAGDISFATRNYMEKHQLLQGSRSPTTEMPRFLDITALKQQPKLL